ncbi:hypothetical protein NE237_016694 [Protea cynaroides]|uniref:Uncharacterized protein n=1 Tax=Protea cynaroides TaxID=273540 RepID=A0A9Q0HFG4_9MAGN|nr:hypothetical protein NE237_016694 [Protea cynaroides]
MVAVVGGKSETYSLFIDPVFGCCDRLVGEEKLYYPNAVNERRRGKVALIAEEEGFRFSFTEKEEDSTAFQRLKRDYEHPWVVLNPPKVVAYKIREVDVAVAGGKSETYSLFVDPIFGRCDRLAGEEKLYYQNQCLNFSALSFDMDLQQMISNQTNFSLEIAKSVLSKEAKDSSIVLYPLSVHVVLSLIAAGS